jgi:hypothetical protein
MKCVHEKISLAHDMPNIISSGGVLRDRRRPHVYVHVAHGADNDAATAGRWTSMKAAGCADMSDRHGHETTSVSH